jgi:hypothetical protein
VPANPGRSEHGLGRALGAQLLEDRIALADILRVGLLFAELVESVQLLEGGIAEHVACRLDDPARPEVSSHDS